MGSSDEQGLREERTASRLPARPTRLSRIPTARGASDPSRTLLVFRAEAADQQDCDDNG